MAYKGFLIHNEIDIENTGKVNENDIIDNKTEETNVDKPTFKDTLKVDGIELERVESSNNSSSNDTSGAVSSGGGGGVSIARDIPEIEKDEDDKQKTVKEKWNDFLNSKDETN